MRLWHEGRQQLSRAGRALLRGYGHSATVRRPARACAAGALPDLRMLALSDNVIGDRGVFDLAVA